ncbi:ABC transporter permease [Arcticibacterium luteifluviistationis]|uniref:ABC transporter permease n=1 Tax=Arcticibacterium luteifluviistationis TaxID=1784714 RepID=A0A2Z4GGS6_9BACT|nr:FtsX-like permease family protein [Arcticibacterium luteifluviistationis]AWW00004.1 ABC transporter permease [Arcticibacterium luteifluviistationis]
MLRNYIKIAWRNLLKNKGFSAINIGGLALGMTVAILIGLWVYDEISFDNTHQKKDRIVQVMQHLQGNGDKNTQAWNPYPMASEIRKLYGSDFEHLSQSNGSYEVLKVGDKKAVHEGKFFEEEITDILTFDFIEGTKSALNDPYSIMLSERVAKSFFGEANAIDKVISIDDKYDVKVTAVYKDFPENSTFKSVAYVMPWKLFEIREAEWLNNMEDPWRPNFTFTYGLLAKNADLETVSAKIKDTRLRNLNERLALQKPEVFLFPMAKWHLYEEFENGINSGGRIEYVWLFGIVGLFVLFLACINFMNLSTAQSEKKAKEVGIRKAIGSKKNQLVFQYLSESVLTTTLALVISIALAFLLLPSFNEIAGKKIQIDWLSPVFWSLLIGFTLIVGLLSGSYPALYLSSFKPVKVLKGTFKAGKMASLPRKALVVVQFTVSIALIIGTLVVFQQINYAKERPLGYNQNNLIFKRISEKEQHSFEAIKNELKSKGLIEEMSESSDPPIGMGSTTTGIDWDGRDKSQNLVVPFFGVSKDYGKTIDWNVIDGRDFSDEFDDVGKAFIINEAAAELFEKGAVGTMTRWDVDQLKVIGVVDNMIVGSPYDQAQPMFYYLNDGQKSFVNIKLSGTKNITESLAGIKAVFAKFDPENAFEYEFADEAYSTKFSSLERLSKLINIFATLAILISCLGLFGLASFMAMQRSKEIGVRKVLGATVTNLWAMLSKDFIILIIISMFIAAPLAAYFMNSWLDGFDYKTNIAWWTFAVTGLGALFITLATVSYQSIKAAIVNPVESLKSE